MIKRAINGEQGPKKVIRIIDRERRKKEKDNHEERK